MARYLPDTKTLIQHIPRCAGTFVEKAIEAADIKFVRWVSKQASWLPKKHSMLNHYHRNQMARVENVAAFVRHPITYYESVFKWLTRMKGKHKGMHDHWRWHPHKTADHWYEEANGHFDDWVWLILRKEPMWYTRMIEQYVGPDGGEFCDFIGRTESVAADLADLLTHLGYSFKPHAFASVERKNAIVSDLVWKGSLKDDVLAVERLVVERFYGDRINERFFNNWLDR